jgi:hypothetical protein
MKTFRCIARIVRFLLTLLLVYAVYTETGPFTAGSMFLIFVAIEIQNQLDINLRLL